MDTSEIKLTPVVIWWKRLISMVFDYMIIGWIANRILRWYFTKFSITRDFFWIQIAFVSVLLLAILYFFILEFYWGRTPGKLLTNTQVVSTNGRDIKAWQILKRTLLRLVVIEGFTFFHKRPIGWHDVLSGTRVVELSEKNIEFAVVTWGPMRRFWMNISAGFFVLFFVVMTAVPAFVFSNWHSPKSLSVEDYEWRELQLGNLSVSAPDEARTLQDNEHWEIQLRTLQFINVNILPEELTPAEKLSKDMILVKLHPLLLVHLAKYDISDDAIWYEYYFDQAPFRASGYFVEIDNSWYQVDFKGFKVDAKDIMRRMFDYSTGQETQL